MARPQRLRRRRIIVVGASAGGLEALQRVLAEFPSQMAAAVFVVIHTAAEAPGVLPTILQRAGLLSASYGANDEPIRSGHIFVAPPDHHLLVERDIVRVTRGPRENGFRPAVDPLFRTAAEAYGPEVAGVVLSGGQNDGTLGLAAIKRAGGVAMVQDPREALAASMPESAIAHVSVDHVATATQIGRLLLSLTKTEIATVKRAPRVSKGRPAPDMAEVGTDLLHSGHASGGMLTVFTCPGCGGPLWEREEGGVLRFRCHVGHAFTGETLFDEQGAAVEQALWTALRALEENAAFRQRMADHMRARGLAQFAERYLAQVGEIETRAAVIRRALVIDEATRGESASAEDVADRAKRSNER